MAVTSIDLGARHIAPVPAPAPAVVEVDALLRRLARAEDRAGWLDALGAAGFPATLCAEDESLQDKALIVWAHGPSHADLYAVPLRAIDAELEDALDEAPSGAVRRPGDVSADELDALLRIEAALGAHDADELDREAWYARAHLGLGSEELPSRKELDRLNGAWRKYRVGRVPGPIAPTRLRAPIVSCLAARRGPF